MILLLGGTSETAPIAEALLTAGYEVLVSTATTAPLAIPQQAQRRSGRLDEEAMARLVEESAIKVIVDATHPYAVIAHETALRVSLRLNVACIRWVRPATAPIHEPHVAYADGHEEAAHMAFESKQTVLLTTGSLHLEPYVHHAASSGCRLVVRVLPAPESMAACRKAGIKEEDVIAARGPFTIEENRTTIRKRQVGVLISKDSGAAGGLPEKIEACRLENCKVVLVRRPIEKNNQQVHTLAELLASIGPSAQFAHAV